MFNKYPRLTSGKVGFNATFDAMRQIFLDKNKSYLKGDPEANLLASIPKKQLRQIIYAYFDAAIKLCAEGKSVQLPRAATLSVRSVFIGKKSLPVVCVDILEPFYEKILPNYQKFVGLSIPDTYDKSRAINPKKDWESKVKALILLMESGYTYPSAKREIRFYEYQLEFLTEEQLQRINFAKEKTKK
jgi:hypothetical protein